MNENSNILLENIKIITHSEIALAIHASTNVTLNQIEISGKSLKHAIHVNRGLNSSIKNCTIKNLTTSSICVFCINESQMIECANNPITNVHANQSFEGFNVTASSQIFITNNVISMNSGNTFIGINAENNRYSKILNNTITHNKTKINKLFLRSPHMVATKHDDTADTEAPHSLNEESLPQTSNPILIGINLDGKEELSTISSNYIKDNISSYATYGIHIQSHIKKSKHAEMGNIRHLHIEQNEISSNIGDEFQYGLYDGDQPSGNSYIKNKISFHGKSLDGTNMPNNILRKANYYLCKPCQIMNLIKEAPADHVNFVAADIENKNLSIY